MEPKLPAPNIGPEQSPGSYNYTIESTPIQVTPERNVEHHREQHEKAVEAAMNTAVQTAATPVLPMPTVSPVVTASPVTIAAPSDDTPLVAGDDDLIEKEWVDKAKRIISETKDDPYKREREVGKLQADYLRKRYGKELGTTE